MRNLICPYCKKPIYEVTKKFGEASHMRGCYHLSFGEKPPKDKITVDYYEINFENCNKDFLEQKLAEGWSVFEIDNTFFDGLQVTRKMASIYGLKLRNIKETFQLERQKLKREQTNIKKYGYKNVLCEGSVAREKRNSSMKEKFGVANFFSIQNFQKILKQKLGDEEYHKRKSERSKKVWQNKSKEEKLTWLENSIHSHIIETDGLYSSKQELLLREYLTKIGYCVIPQKKIENFYYDVFLNGTDILIEYNGDYWHANPNIYKPTDILWGGRQASDIWKRDSFKKEVAKRNGYKLITIWESEFLNEELEDLLNTKFKEIETSLEKFQEK